MDKRKRRLLCMLEGGKKYKWIRGAPPLSYKALAAGVLENYRIYGNTVGGAGVGDLVESGEHAGEYKVPVTISNGTDTLTTPIYLPEPIKMVGDEAGYIDYAEQKIHRVRKNLVSSYLVNPSDGKLYVPVVFAEVDFQPNTEYLITFTVHENGVKLYTNEFIFTSTYYTSELQGKKTVRLKTKDVISSSSYIQGKGWVILKNAKQNPEDFTITDVQIQLASIEDDTYEPYIENTDLDVILPALPTLPGTNVLSVGTAVQPSEIEVKGKIKDL